MLRTPKECAQIQGDLNKALTSPFTLVAGSGRRAATVVIDPQLVGAVGSGTATGLVYYVSFAWRS